MVLYTHYIITSMGEIFIALNSLIDFRMFNPQILTKSGELNLVMSPILLTPLYVLPHMKIGTLTVAVLAI